MLHNRTTTDLVRLAIFAAMAALVLVQAMPAISAGMQGPLPVTPICLRVGSQAPNVLFQSDGLELSDQDKTIMSDNVGGFLSTIKPELQVGELPGDWGVYVINAHTGNKAIRFSGSANGGSYTFCCMQAFNVSIPVTKTMSLSYWIFPQQLNATFEKVDLHCTDGSTLHGLGGVYNFRDTTAPSHVAGQMPINAWSKITCDISKYLPGKTIDAIWIIYDHPNSYGQFRGYIDDIYIPARP